MQNIDQGAENYLEVNRESWNNCTPVHLSSDFYGVEEFIAGKTSLNPIELELLGDITGKKILHLQCHFGQDSISLARLGAEVTGVDFSDAAIHAARELAGKCNVKCRFVESDVYALPGHLEDEFDMIFTSYGVIGWLPDLHKWAGVIKHFLKPGGKLLLVEFHPVMWIFDEHFDRVTYNYFNAGPILEESSGTYTDRDAPIHYRTISWNHSLSEIFRVLEGNGMRLKYFQEYDYSPYNCFKDLIERRPREFVLEKYPGMLPMVFSLVAENKIPF